ncbi:hypothetical protein KL925_000940 [Ogataea polymorpha]|nr:hypothetical protein KL936_000940 [Ogataea polymorpha]KAG7928759.1 hypothetical protein KL925_000940 [Ogataea polymorpha]
MSAIFSYAHAAGAPASSNASKSELENDISNLNLNEKEVDKDTKPAKKAEKSEKKDKKLSRSGSKEPENKPEPAKVEAEPKKAKLAPAPLPATNVWGATPTAVPPKIPSEPIVIPETTSENGPSVAKAASGKEKWVPLKASVVIASNKPISKGSGKKKNKKKNFRDGEAKENKDARKSAKKNGEVREIDTNEGSSSESNTPKPDQPSTIEQHAESAIESNDIKSAEPQQKHFKTNGNGNSFSGRQYRTNYNNHSRRYSGQNGSQNGQNGKSSSPVGQLPYAPYNNRSYNGQNNRNHHSRPSFQQSQYFIPQQPYYTPIPYIPYPAALAPFAPVIPQQPQPIAVPPQDSNMRDAMLQTLAKQIDYYFSTQNLVKDIFLRKHMNDDGYLPLPVLAGFYRVSALSYGDYNLVVESLPHCSNLEYGVIEKEGSKLHKVRANTNPKFWVLPADQRLEQGLDKDSPKPEKNPELGEGN